MRFPKAEPKIVSLIHDIIAGLEVHPDLFPNPPVNAEDLRKQFKTYLDAADTAVDKQAEAKHAVEDKNHELDTAVESSKMILRYAETTTHSDDAALDYLGWGAHREPSRLKSPGQTRHLDAPRQGDGWIALGVSEKRKFRGTGACIEAHPLWSLGAKRQYAHPETTRRRRQGSGLSCPAPGRRFRDLAGCRSGHGAGRPPSPTNRAAFAWSSGSWP
uniref:Uncharacterized protein n=1 Tax=Candidatus Kentrum sp. TC TaxID=2126339 RepID=A0A450ZQT5_9GAMM|nr:MAG: hypothetical protein BECKTC1821F_GA0114240_100929 [Candidatus Kentron sp. TC]